VDAIRNSGGNNIERLLLIAGASEDLYLTCTSDYKMPIDKSNKLAVSIHYFEPYDFTLGTYFDPYNWTDYNGYAIAYGPTLNWGSSLHYKRLFENFNLMNHLLSLFMLWDKKLI